MASGLVNTTQQVGAALGVAVLSTLAAARTGHLLAAGHPAASALTGGYHVAFGTGAGLAAAAFVLAAAVLRPARTEPPAESSDETSTGQVSTGQVSTGQASTGQASTGQASAGQASTGQASTGQASTGLAGADEAEPLTIGDAMTSDIRPELFPEPYVFAAGEAPAGVTPFAVIREDEGVTRS